VVVNDREQAFSSSKLGAKALPVTRIGRAALYRVPGRLPGRSGSPM
jgi:hypothetical protein